MLNDSYYIKLSLIIKVLTFYKYLNLSNLNFTYLLHFKNFMSLKFFYIFVPFTLMLNANVLMLEFKWSK